VPCFVSEGQGVGREDRRVFLMLYSDDTLSLGLGWRGLMISTNRSKVEVWVKTQKVGRMIENPSCPVYMVQTTTAIPDTL
jgi:hypothetical protein